MRSFVGAFTKGEGAAFWLVAALWGVTSSHHHHVVVDAFPPPPSASISHSKSPSLKQQNDIFSTHASFRDNRFIPNNDADDHRRIGVRGGALWATSPASTSDDDDDDDDDDGGPPPPVIRATLTKTRSFVSKNFFLVGMLTSVLFAKVAPSVGRNGGLIRPELFIGNLGVTLIFFLSGLSLETSELTKAATNFKLNSLIQLVIFGAWPLFLGLPLVWSLRTFLPNLIPPALVDGLLILTCLPTTVNMNIMLSSAGGGNVATSIINSVLSNMGGIFVTPALLLRFFGTEISLPFVAMVTKLCNKVLLPVGKYLIRILSNLFYCCG